MNIKQILIATMIAVVSASVLVAVAAPEVLAQSKECGGANTSIIECDEGAGSGQDSGVWALLIIALNILTAGVGIAAVGGLLYAAILYTSAIDSVEQVKKAQDIIENVVIGILSYAGMYLIVNFLIPGGIFT